MRRLILSYLLLLLIASASVAGDDDPAAVERLLDRITQQEAQFVQDLRTHSAILETYIQETPDATGDGSEILKDHYFLGKLDFNKSLDYTAMASRGGEPKTSRLLSLFRNRSAVFLPNGFAQMVLIDGEGFDRKNYQIDYVHREFLGEVRCLVFDVDPLDKKTAGRFKGRIWVEDQGFRVVRFNGIYTNSSSSRIYFHFDSWRVNVAPGQWAPAFIYVEESQPSEKRNPIPRFKAQTRLWGYSIAKTGNIEELTSIAVEAEGSTARDQPETAQATPLESQRSWERQAEANILERLEKSGLLAPPGPVDDVLNTVVNNLIGSNNLNVEAKCRVLLTTPLETFSVGQTIVISRGLLDVLPDEASLAMVLSAELAHIALGHRTDTHFAFSDQTMVGEGELLQRLQLVRPQEQVTAAGDRAIEILSKSPYAPKLSNAGLFLKALNGRAGQLPSLIQANLGNQLASTKSLVSLNELADKAPPLEREKLEQIAALPLGSRVHLDPWTNRISLAKSKPVSLISARDKLPFEVTPFMIFLSRIETRTQDQDPAISSGRPSANAGISIKGTVK